MNKVITYSDAVNSYTEINHIGGIPQEYPPPANRCMTKSKLESNFIISTDLVEDNRLVTKAHIRDLISAFSIEIFRDIIYHRGTYYLIGKLDYFESSSVHHTGIVGIEVDTSLGQNDFEKEGKWKFTQKEIDLQNTGIVLAGFSDSDSLYLAVQYEPPNTGEEDYFWGGGLVVSDRTSVHKVIERFNTTRATGYNTIYNLFIEQGKLVALTSEGEFLETQVSAMDYDYVNKEVVPNTYRGLFSFSEEVESLEYISPFMQRTSDYDDKFNQSIWYIGHTYGWGRHNNLKLVRGILVEGGRWAEITENNITFSTSYRGDANVNINKPYVQGYNPKADRGEVLINYTSSGNLLNGKVFTQNTFSTTLNHLVSQGSTLSMEINGYEYIRVNFNDSIEISYIGIYKKAPNTRSYLKYFIHITTGNRLFMFMQGKSEVLNYELNIPSNVQVVYRKFVNDTLIIIYYDQNGSNAISKYKIKMISIDDIVDKYLSL